MGRPKGGKNKVYTPEMKEKIVKEVIDGVLSVREAAEKYGIYHSNIDRWEKQYLKGGLEEFKRHKYKGNHFAALHTSKSLTTEERLRLENMKLRIENERLKKGYIVKGVGVNKEYVSISDLNIKSSKR